jgi:hypothetical protein
LSNVEKLIKQIESLGLADLCILVGNALHSKLERKRLEILLKYLETAVGRELYFPEPTPKGEHE